jgi:hypothetical protein
MRPFPIAIRAPIRGSLIALSAERSPEQLSWAKEDRAKGAIRVRTMSEKHEGTLSWRHFMALRGAAAYTSVGLGDLFQQLAPWDSPNASRAGFRARNGRQAYEYGGWVTRDAEQWARATTKAVTQKLFGLDEPKTQRVATDVEYELRRQGIWADRWNEGCMHMQQPPFRDTWNLARHGALVAWVSTGMVGALTEPDYVAKRVRTQLRSTLNNFIDPGDCCNGVPLSYFDISWENPEYMCEDHRFTADQRAQIWKSSEVPPQHSQGNYSGPVFGTRMVKVYRAWRMPFGSFKGREALVVKQGDALIWEEWEDPVPPISFYRVSRCLGDTFWSENLIEIMLDPLADAADIDDTAKSVMKLTSQMNIALDGTTVSPKGVLNAKDVNVFKYSSAKKEKPPTFTTPNLLHADYFAWRDRKVAVAQQLSGVPNMHLASESPKGTDSGRAKRLEASLLPERFAENLRDWRNFVACDIANDQVRAARRIGEVEPDWQLTWPGADFGAKVSVKVLDVDDTVYELRPYAVSETKGTPAERAQYAQELFDRKQITADQLSLILDGLYDVPKETKQVAAQRQYFAKAIDDILTAPPDVVEDDAAYLGDRYMQPPIWTEPGQAIAQILPHYWQSMIDGVPQNRRALLKRLMDDVMAVQAGRDKAEQLQQASLSAKVDSGMLGQVPQAAPMGAPQQPQVLPAPGPEAAMGMAPQDVGGPPALA